MIFLKVIYILFHLLLLVAAAAAISYFLIIFRSLPLLRGFLEHKELRIKFHNNMLMYTINLK